MHMDATLPLGLVNFLAIASFERLKDTWGGGFWASGLCAVLSWGVFLAAWVLVALANPRVADNRPQRQLQPLDVDLKS